MTAVLVVDFRLLAGASAPSRQLRRRCSGEKFEVSQNWDYPGLAEATRSIFGQSRRVALIRARWGYGALSWVVDKRRDCDGLLTAPATMGRSDSTPTHVSQVSHARRCLSATLAAANSRHSWAAASE
jgi:hypothetical protein